ncbi:pre-mRNA polyadenylation factor FIP1 [Lactuca sativa]|uniref:pre-mRNA polyadenylation factor FIP1 n=1 Tax=Lactuca sativa TaxID=4236 RepID=UPI0022AF92CF|nr:pre-mRNA polyadenylation factor FIP1 [Lactuca sativa]
MASTSYLYIFAIVLFSIATNEMCFASRNLLQATTFPTLPQPQMPTIPTLPLPQIPSIPNMPKLSFPPLPSMPTIPNFPTTLPNIPFFAPPPSKK